MFGVRDTLTIAAATDNRAARGKTRIAWGGPYAHRGGPRASERARLPPVSEAEAIAEHRRMALRPVHPIASGEIGRGHVAIHGSRIDRAERRADEETGARTDRQVAL